MKCRLINYFSSLLGIIDILVVKTSNNLRKYIEVQLEKFMLNHY